MPAGPLAARTAELGMLLEEQCIFVEVEGFGIQLVVGREVAEPGIAQVNEPKLPVSRPARSCR